MVRIQQVISGDPEVGSEVDQLCLTLCNPMDCSLRGSSTCGISQARVLEWVAICGTYKQFLIESLELGARKCLLCIVHLSLLLSVSLRFYFPRPPFLCLSDLMLCMYTPHTHTHSTPHIHAPLPSSVPLPAPSSSLHCLTSM